MRDQSNRGTFSHDRDTGQFLAKHGSSNLRDGRNDSFARDRSDGTWNNRGSGRDWGSHNWNHGNNWNHHGNNWRHHGHHHHNNFFFVGFGFPFYSPFWYDPFWYPGYGLGFGYFGHNFGFSYGAGFPGYYSAWPYYAYDPYYLDPAPVTYAPATPAYAAAPAYATPIDSADDASSARIQIGSTPSSDGPAIAPPPAPEPAANPSPSSSGFAREGEDAFKARDYQGAVRAWRHALVDDPRNGTLVMMLSQALFAIEQYDEAAGASQQGMVMLPQEDWGVVVSHYAELYRDTQDYVDQLKVLEKAVKEKPKDPALRFLVGFHYGYLGYPVEAVRELDELLKLVPQDQLGRKLRDLMAEKAKEKAPKTVTPDTNSSSGPDGK